MIASENCAAMVREAEGFAAHAYPDYGGFGIGYGHHGAEVKADTVWTRQQAEEALRLDLIARSELVTKRLGSTVVSQNQLDALVCFAYNVRNWQVAAPFRLLDKGRPVEAANSLLMYRMAGGKVLPGLERRRAAERALFLKPDAATG